MSDFPWRLRLVHEGHSAIRVERAGSWLRFDPREPPAADQVSLLTWNQLDRSRGVVQAIRSGQTPRVMAAPELHPWLNQQGQARLEPSCGRIDDLLVESLVYTPIPITTPEETVHALKGSVRHPGTAARRLWRRARSPLARPLVIQLTFADGKRLLHLNGALHEATDAEWLRGAQESFRGADWVMVGVDYGEDEAVLRMLPGFEPGVVLVTDLVNEERQGLGLPTRLLTPTVDRLIGLGLTAYPFVSGASYRYE